MEIEEIYKGRTKTVADTGLMAAGMALVSIGATSLAGGFSFGGAILIVAGLVVIGTYESLP